MIETPQNDIARLLNKMLKQSRRQHQHGIKAIITTEKEEDDKPESKDNPPKLKCICPKVLTKTKKKKKGDRSTVINFRRKNYNGYNVKCPVHHPPL